MSTRPDGRSRLSTSDLGHAVGFKHPGNTGRLWWTFRGDCIEAYRAEYDGVSVNLRCESGTQAQSVQLTSTSCNYGGQRHWFLCPDCGRRAAVFYLVANRWTCRVCGQVLYSCHQEGHAARLARRLRRIRSKLAGSSDLLEPLRPKPKGMHWKTYVTLTNQERRLRENWFQCLAEQL